MVPLDSRFTLSSTPQKDHRLCLAPCRRLYRVVLGAQVTFPFLQDAFSPFSTYPPHLFLFSSLELLFPRCIDSSIQERHVPAHIHQRHEKRGTVHVMQFHFQWYPYCHVSNSATYSCYALPIREYSLLLATEESPGVSCRAWTWSTALSTTTGEHVIDARVLAGYQPAILHISTVDRCTTHAAAVAPAPRRPKFLSGYMQRYIVEKEVPTLHVSLHSRTSLDF